jgi:two-component system, sensor histidine kinase
VHLLQKHLAFCLFWAALSFPGIVHAEAVSIERTTVDGKNTSPATVEEQAQTGDRDAESKQAQRLIWFLLLCCFLLLGGVLAVHRYLQRIIRRKTQQLGKIARQLDDQLRFQRSLLEALPMPVFIKDTNLRYIGANNTFTHIFDKELTEVIGQTAADLTNPTFASAYAEKDRELLKNGGTQIYDFKVQDARGRERHFVFHKALFKEADGKTGGIVGAMLDVTEERLAREQLQASESKFRLLAESSSDVILLNDTTGRTAYVSPSVQEVLGYSAEEFMGRQPEEFILQADADIPRQAIPELIEKGKTSFELRAKHKSGKTIHLEVIAILLDDEEKLHPRRVLNVMRDISRRKEEERCLREAYHQAEQASRAKSEFLALMSHEIRTPMNGIMGMAQILQIRLEEEENLKMLDTILSCGSHLTHVLDQILNLSRIEATSLEIEEAPFSLRPLLQEISTTHRVAIAAKGLEFTADIAPDCKDLLIGDPVRLRQILDNLLHNAAKFTHCGSIALEVRAGKQDSGRQRVLFTVSDTGIGIAGRDLPKLFQPFSQVDASVSRMYEGSGLGLVICKRLAKLMGGDITLRSEPGKGSRFTAVLEFKILKENDSERLPDERDSFFRTSASLRAKFAQKDSPSSARKLPSRILLVEDNQVNALVIEEMLGEWGITCTHAANGQAALEAFAEEKPQLILLDLQMPDMDGYAVLRELRRRSLANGATKPFVVALTAHQLPEDRERCEEAGFDSFLAKPVSFQQLEEVLDRACVASLG